MGVIYVIVTGHVHNCARCAKKIYPGQRARIMMGIGYCQECYAAFKQPMAGGGNMKMDRKMLSSEEYEIDYVRKLARNMRKTLNEYKHLDRVFLTKDEEEQMEHLCNRSEMNRVCMAVLKFAKAKRK